jgi:hypothetical protein
VLSNDLPLFIESGRTYPQLAQIVRELCAVAGACHWLLLLLSPLLLAPAGTPLPGCTLEFAW